jgi:hypothetical protein
MIFAGSSHKYFIFQIGIEMNNEYRPENRASYRKDKLCGKEF